jgi:tRNA threonylcarbamoyladenosine biosynthesis protein TsaE
VISFATRNAEETRALGRRLSQALRPGDVVSLTGPLGSGKTCLIQGLCQNLKIGVKVSNLSFVIWAKLEGRLPVRHVNLYWLRGPSDSEGLGLKELWDGQGGHSGGMGR